MECVKEDCDIFSLVDTYIFILNYPLQYVVATQLIKKIKIYIFNKSPFANRKLIDII